MTLKITPTQVKKTVSLSSPGHAVSLFRRVHFWEAFSVRSRCAFQSQFEVRNEPQSCKILYFLWVLDATFDTEDHTFSGQKTLSLSSPGHAVSPFRRAGFGKPFWSEVDAHVKANSRCEMIPQAAKSSIFYGFWTRRLTLKITHSQVKKRCP